MSVGQFLGRFADDTVRAAGRIVTADSFNPVGDLVARAAGGSQAVRAGMDSVSPVAGVVTSGYGLAADAVDALQSDGGGNSATGVDAARTGLFDGPGAVSVIGITARALR
ncbi:hypothetical protein [Streptomyces sp. NPDC047079]|uniref:hypothetical protein n=1 Tax=Streptomyces sp. NPDC047079 TaxID=3154607 RepID=UPI0033D515F3